MTPTMLQCLNAMMNGWYYAPGYLPYRKTTFDALEHMCINYMLNENQ